MRTSRLLAYVNRLAVVLMMAVAVVVVEASPVVAHHCGGTTTITGSGGGVSYECHGNAPGAPPPVVSSQGTWEAYCLYSTTQNGVQAWAEGNTVSSHRQRTLTLDEMVLHKLPINGTYAFYRVDCHRADGSGFVGGLFIWTEDPPVDPEVLRDRAAARIDLVPPEIGTSPDFSEFPAIVQMETWLWTTDVWETKHDFEEQGFLRVDVYARPDNITWTFGDGNQVVCAGPGVEWTPSADYGGTYCSHTFTSSSSGLPNSAYTASATLSWVFSWSINTVDQGDFGTVTQTTDFLIQVGEIQAVESGS